MRQSILEKPQESFGEAPDAKVLTALNELKNKQIEIEEALRSAEGDKAQILQMDLEDVLNKIKQHEISFRKIRKDKGLTSLKEKAGKGNVVDMLKFKKKKAKNGGIALSDEEQEKAGNLINDLDEFKRKKGIG